MIEFVALRFRLETIPPGDDLGAIHQVEEVGAVGLVDCVEAIVRQPFADEIVIGFAEPAIDWPVDAFRHSRLTLRPGAGGEHAVLPPDEVGSAPSQHAGASQWQASEASAAHAKSTWFAIGIAIVIDHERASPGNSACHVSLLRSARPAAVSIPRSNAAETGSTALRFLIRSLIV
jgi:hypothetical protein